MDTGQGEITSLLSAAGNGDTQAAELLWHAVYNELHRIAHARMVRERRRGEVQTTVLVQEAYLRLAGRASEDDSDPQARLAALANRRRFFAAAARAMRQFLVDDARRRGRHKRGGGRPGGCGEAAAAVDGDPTDVLALDEALTRLRERDPRKADIVQLRYFAGLSIDETAAVLEVSPRLVDQEWRFAKAWLHRELSG